MQMNFTPESVKLLPLLHMNQNLCTTTTSPRPTKKRKKGYADAVQAWQVRILACFVLLK